MLPVLLGLAALALFADDENEESANEGLDTGNSGVNTGNTSDAGGGKPPAKQKPALKKEKSHELQVSSENGGDRPSRGSGSEPGGSTADSD
jgi:hypothetical protein